MIYFSKLSQASVTDLSNKMNASQQSGGQAADMGKLKKILSTIMGGSSDDKLSEGEKIQQQSQAYHFDPDNSFPPEVKKQLVDLLKWHDDVMRQIHRRMEMVPGLNDMLEEFSNALNACESWIRRVRLCELRSHPRLDIYTVIAPYVTVSLMLLGDF